MRKGSVAVEPPPPVAMSRPVAPDMPVTVAPAFPKNKDVPMGNCHAASPVATAMRLVAMTGVCRSIRRRITAAVVATPARTVLAVKTASAKLVRQVDRVLRPVRRMVAAHMKSVPAASANLWRFMRVTSAIPQSSAFQGCHAVQVSVQTTRRTAPHAVPAMPSACQVMSALVGRVNRQAVRPAWTTRLFASQTDVDAAAQMGIADCSTCTVATRVAIERAVLV